MNNIIRYSCRNTHRGCRNCRGLGAWGIRVRYHAFIPPSSLTLKMQLIINQVFVKSTCQTRTNAT
jgi:hypothetical protein